MYATYYYLDTDERRKFTQNPHEYLIEQVQNQTENIDSILNENSFLLNLNHPVKEIIWTFSRNRLNCYAPQNEFSIGYNKISNSNASQLSPLYNLNLLLNGHDRFRPRMGEYFRLAQPYEHHTRIPKNYIYSYSFALRPEEHQPSGTCNFSRIDNSHLVFRIRNNITGNEGNGDGNVLEPYSVVPTLNLWAVSYNILRIMSGMGGLAYSN